MTRPSALEVMDRYGPLGPDFLTWLAASVRAGNLPSPPSEPGMQVDLRGPLLFEAPFGDATKMTLAGADAGTAPEVSAALRQGKRLRRARLEFTVVDARWEFTLDAETFDLRGAKLPVPKVPDLDEYLRMRVQALQHLARIVEELFELFLAVRLDAARWKEEVGNWTRG